MSEDMPWVIGLTDEEVQELRKNKQELTQYGKEKIKKLLDKSNQVSYNTHNNGDEPMSNTVTAFVNEEDYQVLLTALEQYQQTKNTEEHQEVESTILNNPISRVIATRTVWSKELDASVTEGLVSFDGEEPTWIPLRTIQGIYSYLSKSFNSVQI